MEISLIQNHSPDLYPLGKKIQDTTTGMLIVQLQNQARSALPEKIESQWHKVHITQSSNLQIGRREEEFVLIWRMIKARLKLRDTVG